MALTPSLRWTLLPILLLLAGCDSAQPALQSSTAPLLSLPPLDGGVGNGAVLKSQCAGCGVTGISTIRLALLSAEGLTPAMPPTGWANSSLSFVSPTAFNFVDTAGSSGLSPEWPLSTITTATHNDWTVTYSGYVVVAPSASPTVKSFSVASDDGYLLAVSDGTQVNLSQYPMGRGYAWGDSNGRPLPVTFPAGGGLFPFYLLYFNGGGGSGTSFAWFDGATTATSGGGFSLVPATALASPDVHATVWPTGGPTPVPNGSFTLHVDVENRGLVPFGVHNVALPLASGQGAITGGTPPPGATCITGPSGFNCSTRQAIGPGGVEHYAFTYQVPDADAGTAVALQPYVTGPAADPSLLNVVADAGQYNGAFTDVFVLADYPMRGIGAAVVDTGNAPAGFPGLDGGTDDDNPFSFTVGQPLPATAILTSPSGPVSTTWPVTVAGVLSLPPGDTLTVSIAGPVSFPLSCTAGASTFSCLPLPLPEGTYTVTMRVADGAGQGVASTATMVVRPPDPPTIITPAEWSTVRTSPVLVAGSSGEGAGAKVDVLGGLGCNSIVQSDGSWSCTLALTDGLQELSASVRKAVGLPGPATIRWFTVDTAPGAPTLDPVPTPSSNAQPLFSGTGEPTATVTVSAALEGGATTLCSATVAGDGSWTCTSTLALPDGQTLVSATQALATTLESAAAQVAVVVDTVPPSAPTIDVPAGPIANASPPLLGTAEAASTVQVSTSSATVCTAVADPSGHWICASQNLVEGVNALSVSARDAAGNMSHGTSASLIVDTTAPDAPTIDSPASGAVLTDTPDVHGRAEPGAQVEVTLDGVVVAVVAADDGSWSNTPAAALPVGAHFASAVAIDQAGNRGAASSVTAFQVQAPIVPAVHIGATVPTVPSTATAPNTQHGCNSVPGALPIAALLWGTVRRRRW